MDIRVKSFGQYWAWLTVCCTLAIAIFLAQEFLIGGGQFGIAQGLPVAVVVVLYFTFLTASWRRFKRPTTRVRANLDRPVVDLGDLKNPDPEKLARAIDPYRALRNPPDA
jgi:hypothetical protein